MASTTMLDPGNRRGFLASLLGMYLAPAKEFLAILPGARWLAPLVALVILQVAFTGVWLRKIDRVEFVKAEVERSGRMERIPVDQREQLFEKQAAFVPVFAWVGAVAGAPVGLLILGGVYVFIMRFFLASEVSFKKILSVIAWSFLAVSAVTTPLVLATLYLKGDWSVNPRMALQANPAMFLDAESTPKALYSLFDSVDLFSFWLLFLLYAGFRVATSKKPGPVAAGVLIPWVLYVGAKSVLAMLF
jgi:hypothetical protein